MLCIEHGPKHNQQSILTAYQSCETVKRGREVKEREQSSYRWAYLRAHMVANLLEGLSIKEDSVESSTWDRFSVALEAIDSAIALLDAVREALKAISACADDKEVVRLTLATTVLEDMCRVVHRHMNETAPKVEKAVGQHQHK